MIASPWYEGGRQSGDDVRELLHVGHPTACLADAAFGYENAFSAHVNVGVFLGAHLADRPASVCRIASCSDISRSSASASAH